MADPVVAQRGTVSVAVNGIYCINPRGNQELTEILLEAGVDRVNNFRNPGGRDPGMGYFLLLRSDIESTSDTPFYSVTIVDGTTTITINELVIVDKWSVFPSTDGPNDLMVVKLADYRYVAVRNQNKSDSDFFPSCPGLPAQGDPETTTNESAIEQYWNDAMGSLSIFADKVDLTNAALPMVVTRDVKIAQDKSSWDIVNDVLALYSHRVYKSPNTTGFSITKLSYESANNINTFANNQGRRTGEKQFDILQSAYLPRRVNVRFRQLEGDILNKNSDEDLEFTIPYDGIEPTIGSLTLTVEAFNIYDRLNDEKDEDDMSYKDQLEILAEDIANSYFDSFLNNAKRDGTFFGAILFAHSPDTDIIEWYQDVADGTYKTEVTSLNLRTHQFPDMMYVDSTHDTYYAIPPFNNVIPKRSGITPGSVECCIYRINDEGNLEQVKLDDKPYTETVFNNFEKPCGYDFHPVARLKSGQLIVLNEPGSTDIGGNTVPSDSTPSNPVPSGPNEVSTTTTTPDPIVPQCVGACTFEWDDTGKKWDEVANTCSTTTSTTTTSTTTTRPPFDPTSTTSTTTTAFPTTTTTSCLCCPDSTGTTSEPDPPCEGTCEWTNTSEGWVSILDPCEVDCDCAEPDTLNQVYTLGASSGGTNQYDLTLTAGASNAELSIAETMPDPDHVLSVQVLVDGSYEVDISAPPGTSLPYSNTSLTLGNNIIIGVYLYNTYTGAVVEGSTAAWTFELEDGDNKVAFTACGSGTTTTTTTTAEPTCSCVPPEFCGVEDGDLYVAQCSIYTHTTPYCSSTTTTSCDCATTTTADPGATTTTTLGPGGCECGPNSEDCGWIWTTAFGWIRTSGNCCLNCPCPVPTDASPAECQEYTTSCGIPPDGGTPGDPQCAGSCLYYALPDAIGNGIIFLQDGCTDPGFTCFCVPPSSWVECTYIATPCNTPDGQTTPAPDDPCEPCYTSSTTTTTEATEFSCCQEVEIPGGGVIYPCTTVDDCGKCDGLNGLNVACLDGPCEMPFCDVPTTTTKAPCAAGMCVYRCPQSAPYDWVYVSDDCETDCACSAPDNADCTAGNAGENISFPCQPDTTTTPPVGICCDGTLTGSCAENITQETCEDPANSGVWDGGINDCTGDPCATTTTTTTTAEPTAICCGYTPAFKGCLEGLTQSECEGKPLFGVWQEGVTVCVDGVTCMSAPDFCEEFSCTYECLDGEWVLTEDCGGPSQCRCPAVNPGPGACMKGGVIVQSCFDSMP